MFIEKKAMPVVPILPLQEINEISESALELVKLIPVLLEQLMKQFTNFKIEATDPLTVMQLAEFVWKRIPLHETVPAVERVQFPTIVTFGV